MDTIATLQVHKLPYMPRKRDFFQANYAKSKDFKEILCSSILVEKLWLTQFLFNAELIEVASQMSDTIILTTMERKRERDWNVCVCKREGGKELT